MTFAGLSNPQDRANVIAFLNAHSDAPQPLPAAPAEAAAACRGDKPGTGPNNGPQKAEKEPTLPAEAAGKTPQTGGGEAEQPARSLRLRLLRRRRSDRGCGAGCSS